MAHHRELGPIENISYDKYNKIVFFSIPYIRYYMDQDSNYLWNNDGIDNDYIQFTTSTNIGTPIEVYDPHEEKWKETSVAHIDIPTIIQVGKNELYGNGQSETKIYADDWGDYGGQSFQFRFTLTSSNFLNYDFISFDVQGYFYPGKKTPTQVNDGGGYTHNTESRKIYPIIYNSNTTEHISNMINYDIKIHNQNYYIHNQIPQRTGYTFIGWDTKKNWSNDGSEDAFLYYPPCMQGIGAKDYDYTGTNQKINFYAIWLPSLAIASFKNFEKNNNNEMWIYNKNFQKIITFQNSINGNFIPPIPENELNSNGTCGGWQDINSHKIYSSLDNISIPPSITKYDQNKNIYILEPHSYIFQPIWTTLDNLYLQTTISSYINSSIKYDITIFGDILAKVFQNKNQITILPIGDIYCNQWNTKTQTFMSKQQHSIKNYYGYNKNINHIYCHFTGIINSKSELQDMIFKIYYQEGWDKYKTKECNLTIDLSKVFQQPNIKISSTTQKIKVSKTINKIHIKC